MVLIAIMNCMYSVFNPACPSNRTICICYCTRVYLSLWTQGSVLCLKTHLPFIQFSEKKKYSFYHVKFTYFSIMSTGFRSRLCTLGDLKKVHAVLSVRVAEKRETEQLLYRGVASFNNLCHMNTFHARSFKRDFGGMQSFSLCSKTKLPRSNSAACSNFILYTHQLLKHSSC